MSSDIVEALNHIYFGDEACKSIVLDGWNELIAFQITRVVKFEGSTWSPGVGEEICDAYMVFTGATAITFDPPGFLPNDLMNDISATRDEGKTSYRVTASIDCVLECGNRQEVVIAFNADGLSVENITGHKGRSAEGCNTSAPRSQSAQRAHFPRPDSINKVVQ